MVLVQMVHMLMWVQHGGMRAKFYLGISGHGAFAHRLELACIDAFMHLLVPSFRNLDAS